MYDLRQTDKGVDREKRNEANLLSRRREDAMHIHLVVPTSGSTSRRRINPFKCFGARSQSTVHKHVTKKAPNHA